MQDSIKWKLLEVMPDYKVYVSNNGQIKTPSVNYKRSNGRPMNRKGKLLKPGLDQDGYYRVVFSHKSIRKTYFVHRLVAEAFLKTFNDNLQVNHKDGNKTNNNYDNLEMCTLQENIRHSIENGLKPKLTRDKLGRFNGKVGGANEQFFYI